MGTIKLNNKLTNLAQVLVPQQIRDNSPQYFNLVLAFLENIQRVQDSININFLDTIDINKIENEQIIQLYIDTYLAQMNLDNLESPSAMVDLLRVSKDISTKKGTIIIYSILLKLLVYLIPTIGTQYASIQNQIKTETNPERIRDLEQTLAQLRADNNDQGFLDYFNFNRTTSLKQSFDPSNSENENVIPFRYRLESDLEQEIFDRYFKPFCHPIGWDVDFVTVIQQALNDSLVLGFSFIIHDLIILPKTTYNSGITANNPYSTDGVEYPLNRLNDFVLGTDTDENFNTIRNKITNPDRLVRNGTNIIYRLEDFKTELPYRDSSGNINPDIERQSLRGDFLNLDRLKYTTVQPRTGRMTIFNSIYKYNNKIAGYNGGLYYNYNNRLVLYRKHFDNLRN